MLSISEGLVRLLAPQAPTSTFIDGKPPGIKDDTLGYLNRPDANWRETCPEYSAEYHLGPEGFRPRKEAIEVFPPGGTSRILLLGDSFTFCKGAEDRHTWPEVLRRKLEDKGFIVEVINAGVQGYDTRQEVIRLMELVPRYHPDLVIMALLPNDIWANQELVPDPNNPENREGSLVIARDETPFQLQLVMLGQKLLLSNNWLYTRIYLGRRKSRYFIHPPDEEVIKQLDITRGLIREARDFCRQEDVKFILVSIPQLFQVLVKAGDYSADRVDPDMIDRKMETWCRSNKIDYIKTLPVLAQTYRTDGRELYFRVDGHLNIEGNELLGGYLADKIARILDE